MSGGVTPCMDDECYVQMKRAAIFVGCGSFFFVYRSPETRSHTAFFQSPLTAKLTAKPVDNSGFPWMAVDIRLASGADGRHWWMAKNKKCRRGTPAHPFLTYAFEMACLLDEMSVHHDGTDRMTVHLTVY